MGQSASLTSATVLLAGHRPARPPPMPRLLMCQCRALFTHYLQCTSRDSDKKPLNKYRGRLLCLCSSSQMHFPALFGISRICPTLISHSLWLKNWKCLSNPRGQWISIAASEFHQYKQDQNVSPRLQPCSDVGNKPTHASCPLIQAFLSAFAQNSTCTYLVFLAGSNGRVWCSSLAL